MLPEPGFEHFYDVGIHSDGYELSYGHVHRGGEINPEIVLPFDVFVERIKADPGYHGGPIRLVACYAGKYPDGVAKQLADRLGVPVRAPNKRVYVDFDGKYRLAESDLENNAIINKIVEESGKWETFYPGQRLPQ